MPHRVIRGIAVSPGLAVGPALVVRWEVPTVPDTAITPDAVDGEIERLHAALDAAREAIEGVRTRAAERAGPEEARIFDAQLMILADTDLVSGVERLIRDNHFSAARAFEFKMLEWRGLWTSHGNSQLRERLMDLTDVEIRVLTRLLGAEEADPLAQTRAGRPVILIAHDLTPSLTVQLDRDAVLAVACEQGTRTSHAAILAHAIGIPAVVGLRDVMNRVETGEQVVLDGWAGTLHVDPDAAEVESASARDLQQRALAEELESASDLPAVTTDGVALTLRANLDLPEELGAAARHRAAGVGLMRTEFLVVGRSTMPTEDEQVAYYERVARALPDYPIVVRTYDLGGDKFPAGLRPGAEANPMLGWRAIRVCLDQPEIFRPQVRALLRAAAAAPVRLMIPLVTGVEEVDATRAIVETEARVMRLAGVPVAERLSVGVMIETPAAVQMADRLAEVADFLSIGTNDLTQYTLAVDRGNARLSDRFSPLHPAVLRSLDHVRRAGEAQGIEVSVCGGMASEPLTAYCLIALGFRVLSVAAPSLPLVRWLVRQVDASVAAAVGRTLLEQRDAAGAIAVAREGLGRIIDLAVVAHAV